MTGAGGAAHDRPGAPDVITIVLVDDHALVRAGLRLLLDAEAGFSVVAEAGDLTAAERWLSLHRPAVLVLDVHLSAGSSIPAIPRLRAASPQTRIVMLSMGTDPAAAREALREGATGYVLKEAAQGELIQAVRLAAAGRTYLAPELGARLAAGEAARPGPPDDLTAREVDVLRLLARGHTNNEVAAQLYLSVRTVESHRAHIQRKTRCGSRAALVAYAERHGLA